MAAIFLAIFLSILLLSTLYNAIQIGELEVNIGAERGISSSSSSVSPETLSRIMEGVKKGNADNIYFYGLLKMYGISMIKDVKGAASEFRRAAEKGHKDAATALGVMLLSGAMGEKDDIEAVSFLRKGVSLGDQVGCRYYHYYLLSPLSPYLILIPLIVRMPSGCWPCK